MRAGVPSAKRGLAGARKQSFGIEHLTAIHFLPKLCPTSGAGESVGTTAGPKAAK